MSHPVIGMMSKCPSCKITLNPRQAELLPFPMHHQHYPCKQELEILQYNSVAHHDANFLQQLPQLESPKVPQSAPNLSSSILYGSSSLTHEDHMQHCHQQSLNSLYGDQAVEQVTTDWRVLDKFVASQLSHEQDASKETTYSNNAAVVLHVAEQIAMLANEAKRPENIAQEYASTSTSSCQIDLWK